MLELQGVARRAGAGACTLTLVGLCLGASAPASFADQRGTPATHPASHPASHPADPRADRPAEQRATKPAGKPATPAHPKPVKPAHPKPRPAAHPARPAHPVHPAHPAHPVKQVQAEKPAHIELHDLLLPGALSTADAPTRHASAIVRSVAAVVAAPAAAVPETAEPQAAAPVDSVVVAQAARSKTAKASAATVSAEALLDVTTVLPAASHSVLAPRRVALGQAVSSRAALARPAGPALTRAAVVTQQVDRDAPRLGAWPTGPVSLPAAPTGLPVYVALGGLALALGAARGVARMRHPRTDDPDLSFPTA